LPGACDVRCVSSSTSVVSFPADGGDHEGRPQDRHATTIEDLRREAKHRGAAHRLRTSALDLHGGIRAVRRRFVETRCKVKPLVGALVERDVQDDVGRSRLGHRDALRQVARGRNGDRELRLADTRDLIQSVAVRRRGQRAGLERAHGHGLPPPIGRVVAVSVTLAAELQRGSPRDRARSFRRCSRPQRHVPDSVRL
jgi:hypothetical protein